MDREEDTKERTREREGRGMMRGKGNERGEDDEKENGCSYSSDLPLQIRFLHITEIFS